MWLKRTDNEYDVHLLKYCAFKNFFSLKLTATQKAPWSYWKEINYESAKAIVPSSFSLSQAFPPTLHMLLALYSIKREMCVLSNVAKKVTELHKTPWEKQHILLRYICSQKCYPHTTCVRLTSRCLFKWVLPQTGLEWKLGICILFLVFNYSWQTIWY